MQLDQLQAFSVAELATKVVLACSYTVRSRNSQLFNRVRNQRAQLEAAKSHLSHYGNQTIPEELKQDKEVPVHTSLAASLLLWRVIGPGGGSTRNYLDLYWVFC